MIIFHAQGFRPDSEVPTMLDQMFSSEADALQEVCHCLKGASVKVQHVEGGWAFLRVDGARFVIERRSVH